MNARILIVLGVVTVGVLALALFQGTRVADTDTAEPELFVPSVADAVNDIAAIDLVAPGGEVTVRLRRDEDRWRVENKHGYEADFRQVHDLLRDLASAERVEAKTARADWYGRLGVTRIDDSDAGGVALRFPDRDLPGVLIGNRDPAGIGRYVRIEGVDQSWLIDQDLDVALDPVDWVEKAVMNIPANEIDRVTITHPDGDRVELRASDGDERTWVLMDAPDGREVKPSWQLRQSANALATVNLEDVRPHERTPEEAVTAEFVTIDDLRFVATAFEDGDGYWVHFNVEPVAPESESGAGTGQASAEPRDGEQSDPADAEADTERSVDAATVDARLSPWQFRIPQSRFDSMTRRLEDFLQAEDSGGGSDA
jgi:hypothetical protein